MPPSVRGWRSASALSRACTSLREKIRATRCGRSRGIRARTVEHGSSAWRRSVSCTRPRLPSSIRGRAHRHPRSQAPILSSFIGSIRRRKRFCTRTTHFIPTPNGGGRPSATTASIDTHSWPSTSEARILTRVFSSSGRGRRARSALRAKPRAPARAVGPAARSAGLVCERFFGIELQGGVEQSVARRSSLATGRPIRAGILAGDERLHVDGASAGVTGSLEIAARVRQAQPYRPNARDLRSRFPARAQQRHRMSPFPISAPIAPAPDRDARVALDSRRRQRFGGAHRAPLRASIWDRTLCATGCRCRRRRHVAGASASASRPRSYRANPDSSVHRVAGSEA